MRVPLIYKSAPIFGFDIGSRTIKMVQLREGKNRVAGYGYADFPADAIVEGIISDPEAISKPVKALLSRLPAGHISAQRVTVALPAAKVFIRTLQLPPMDKNDLEQAIRFEAEQYVPVPITDLYIDYETIQADKGDAGHNDVLMVAAPRAIVDSYIKLFDYLNLEIETIETSLAALTRAMIASGSVQGTTLVIDFGSHSADMAVFQKVIRLTGTIPVGGDELSAVLIKQLGITADQANEIKYKFGIGPSGLQSKIKTALGPQLTSIANETKKILKFYQERSENKNPVTQVVISGGSASMPGMVEFLSHELGLPVSIGNPWAKLDARGLPAVEKLDAPMYATAIGLALGGNHD